VDYLKLIDKYYSSEPQLRELLLVHSRAVADLSVQIVDRHPELCADRLFVEEAAMLHDIGIIGTDAPGIFCHGDKPYICHGTIGAEMLRGEGLDRHALVCERHTGAGISLSQIISENLPLPHRDLLPVSIEERIICYADKFYSKTRPTERKSVDRALLSLEKFGKEGVDRFKAWIEMFE
jgi:uncharacterized protein